MRMKLDYHEDAAHGWLKVPTAWVRALSIHVSSYSYKRGSDMYLEEDCDMPRFLAAAQAAGWLVEVNPVYDGDHSPIRAYPSAAPSNELHGAR